MVHTDQPGVATVNLAVHYVQAPNPLRIGVEAIDTNVRPPHLERVRRVRPRPRTAVASPASPRRVGTRENVRTAMPDHTARPCSSEGRGAVSY